MAGDDAAAPGRVPARRTPGVHVLVPAYGRVGYLRETLGSLVGARDRSARPAAVELTVVDDAWPGDDVAALCAESAFSGVGYVRNEKNLGLVANFNLCAALSRGEFTVIMGSDDLVLPSYFDALEGCLTAFPAADLVQPVVTVIDESGEPCRPLGDRVKALLRPRARTSRGTLVSGQALATRLLAGNFLYFPSIAWRTAVLRETPFDERAGVATDLDVELRLVSRGSSVAVAGGPTTFLYRRHKQSLSMQGGAAGTRIGEETWVHRSAAERARQQGWTTARAMAYAQPTARLNRALAVGAGWVAGARGRG